MPQGWTPVRNAAPSAWTPVAEPTPLDPRWSRDMLEQSTEEGDPRATRYPGIGNQGVRDTMDAAHRSAVALRQDAIDHPIRTAISIVAPKAIKMAGSALRPYVKPAIRAIGETFENPIIGGLVGATEGIARKGLTPSALIDAAWGATGGHVLGRVMRRIGGPAPSDANRGGTLRPRTEPPNSLGREGLREILDEARTPPATLTPSHPSGGGFTVPPPANPNAGGTLRPGTPRQNQLHEILKEGMQPTSASVAPSHPSGGGFTVPPNMSTRPLVTYSPKADAARRSSARAEPMPGLESNELAVITKRYRELSRKLILTPDETRELATLKPRIEGSAREVGMTYPAAGSPRNAARNRRTGEVMLDASGETMRRQALLARMNP